MSDLTNVPALVEESRHARSETDRIIADVVRSFPYGGQRLQVKELLTLARARESLRTANCVAAAAFLQTAGASDDISRLGALVIACGKALPVSRVCDAATGADFARRFVALTPRTWYRLEKVQKLAATPFDAEPFRNWWLILNQAYVPSKDAREARSIFEKLRAQFDAIELPDFEAVPTDNEPRAELLLVAATHNYVSGTLKQVDALTQYCVHVESGETDFMHIMRTGMLSIVAGTEVVPLIESHTISQETAHEFARVQAAVELRRVEDFVIRFGMIGKNQQTT